MSETGFIFISLVYIVEASHTDTSVALPRTEVSVSSSFYFSHSLDHISYIAHVDLDLGTNSIVIKLLYLVLKCRS